MNRTRNFTQVSTASVAQRRTTEFYDNAAAAYARYEDGFCMETILGELYKDIRHGHVVFDLGCGGGRDLQALRGLTSRAVGVDLSDGLLREAQNRTSAPLIRADLSGLPFLSQSCDWIIAIASLHHLRDAQQSAALMEIRRVLRKGGSALITLKVGKGTATRTDPITKNRRYFYLVPTATFIQRAGACGLLASAYSESSEIRHGEHQRWLAVRLRPTAY